MTTYSTRGEQDAYIAGLEAHAETQRIIASPEYRAGDPVAHAKVRRHFLEAYGDAPVATHAVDRGGVTGNAPFGGTR